MPFRCQPSYIWPSRSLPRRPSTSPVNPADGKIQEEITAAAHQSLKNIGAILKEAGMTYDNVVKTTVLLADIADFKAVNEVYAEYFTGDKPARACYQAAALPLGVKVEIEAIAVK